MTDLTDRFQTCAACGSPVAVKWVKVCRRCAMRLGPVCAETHKCETKAPAKQEELPR